MFSPLSGKLFLVDTPQGCHICIIINGAREGGLKLILISRESQVGGTSGCLFSSLLLTSEVKNRTLVSITIYSCAPECIQNVLNMSCAFVLSRLPLLSLKVRADLQFAQ